LDEIIFHHYAQSPVAEKVRVAFGILDASWRSVTIPRIPPKPDLVLLTGGYRRTPVMQIGADIYCDSMCILQQLDRLFPDANFINRQQRLQAMGFASWANGALFDHVVRVVIGHNIDALPPEFLEDRARLYFGPDWTKKSIQAGVAQSLLQCETLLLWMQQTLDMSAQFLAGDRPDIVDALCYYVVWFLRGRYAQGPDLLDRFAGVTQWERRMQQLGHGQASDLSSGDAIAIASDATPRALPEEGKDTLVAQGRQVAVVPDGDGGDPPVIGELVFCNGDELIIARQNEQTGTTHVHFPQSGYRLDFL